MRRDRCLNEDGSPKVRMTRAEARGAARRFPESERMTAYRCGDHWHVGHTPNPPPNYSVMEHRPVSPDPWDDPPRRRVVFDMDTLRVLWRRWIRQ